MLKIKHDLILYSYLCFRLTENNTTVKSKMAVHLQKNLCIFLKYLHEDLECA